MASSIVVIDPASGETAWQPRLGLVGESFIARQLGLAEEERARVVAEAQDILSVALPPAVRGSRTVLVVGRVQSGKTLSFEMLTALARDNGYGLVIIIAGISKYLMRQTRSRFSRDLQLEDVTSGAYEQWLLLTSGQMMSGDDLNLPVVLDEWRNRQEGAELPQTAVVVTLKHYGHIGTVIKAIPHGFSVPTLIIDDEADQAGLNVNANKAGRIPSTTFRSLAQLRDRLASHTYVQYTATPQANLLLAAADTLAPDAVRMITPGDGYVGNSDFVDADPPLIREIPDDEASVFQPSVPITEPPESLVKAIDTFLVAASLGWRAGDEAGLPYPRQLSMLVHPERLVSEHSKATKWVEARLKVLRGLDDATLATRLEGALDEIKRTSTDGDLPASCAEIVAEIRKTLRLTGVIVLNRGEEGYSGDSGEDIPWSSQYAWIVVGGQMVDRGLTIPDLAVTYIPRSAGKNVDTVQQRARWLGYKRSYLDRCRIWMTSATEEFFSDYAEHEIEMHRQIERIVEEEIPLKQWRRQFLLDPQWRPTRRNVISRDVQQHALELWEPFLTLGAGDPPTDQIASAFIDLEAYARGLASFDGEAEYGHTWSDCTLQEAFDLVDLYPVYDLDGADLKALLLGHLARRIEREAPDADVARVYLMNDLNRHDPRDRGVNAQHDPVTIKALLQGRNAAYPGDREMRRVERDGSPLTLQLHRVRPTLEKRNGPPLWAAGKTTIVLAAYIPPGSDPGWVVESID